ncbi:MAG: DNA/RNA nuclease SfsA, partial [Bdellovibrionales bacterium]|nr:DNA/RNA nuclease SfsA [Bdellovibrionales bacterium]
MDFPSDLKTGVLLKRYKRFFADILYEGQVLTAHVPNTGSLKGCLSPEAPCEFTLNEDPKRKLKATLHFIKTPTSWVGVDTSLPNTLVWEAFQLKKFPHWHSYSGGHREAKISKSTRLDMVLWKTPPHPSGKWSMEYLDQGPFRFVEVKNVTLAEDGVALFPDAKTERGQKHLSEMMELVQQGHEAELVFTVQRQDCKSLKPADDIDPEYGRLLREASKAGVQISAFAFEKGPKSLRLHPAPL